MKRHSWVIGLGLWVATSSTAWTQDKATAFDEERLEIALPGGWKVSEQPMQGRETAGGWESSDRKTSFYVIKVTLPAQGDLRATLQQTVDAFDQDENWLVSHIGEFRNITINELPAVYSKVELELRFGAQKVPYVFHLALVGAKESVFLLQGSTMKPVWQPREDELIRMIKSFKVLKE